MEPSTEPFGSPRRIWLREPGTPRNLEKLGGTLVAPWRNLGGTLMKPWGNLGATLRGTFWQPKTDLPQRTRDTTKLGEPWWNLGESLAEPWWNDRESESYSAPKPLLWLKTPNLLLLGKDALRMYCGMVLVQLWRSATTSEPGPMLKQTQSLTHKAEMDTVALHHLQTWCSERVFLDGKSLPSISNLEPLHVFWLIAQTVLSVSL